MRFCYSCMQEIADNRGDICPHCGEKLDIGYNADTCLRPGTILQNKFIVGKLLGAGGFGNTYIGWNKLLRCKVAIKEYFPKQFSGRERNSGTVTVSADAGRQQRFRIGLHHFMEEARSIANLQDVKGVVQVYGFFEEYGTGYIVMEYLEGMDVKHILKLRGNRAEYDWSRRVILTVLYTLSEVHERGVIHRDIAPDNIFVTNEGVIKLIDFGAAKFSARKSDESTEIVLKEGYAPIEQYSRTAPQGPYTDLYAVAALFYRMLTGAKPQAANERIQNDRLLSLHEVGMEIPQKAEDAIMKCLSVQPQNRLQNAADFMEALDGSSFVPVYEPEWILPHIEEGENTVFDKLRKKIGAMAAWQKAAVLVGTLAVVVGISAAGASAVTNVLNKNRGFNTGSNVEKIAAFQRGKTTWESYRENIKKAGCTSKITYVYDKNSKSETVEDTVPRPGELLPDNNIIKVTIKSPKKVTIGEMQQKSRSQIEEKLKECGISSGVRFEYDYNNAKPEACFRQSKKGDISSSDISKLTFYISWGSKADYMLKIPNLAGKTPSEAQRLIDGLNEKFDCRIKVKTGREQISQSVGKGKIISQTPVAGKEFNSNSKDSKIAAKEKVPQKVEVTVSLGKPTPKPTAKPTPKPAAPKEENKKTQSKPQTNSKSSSGSKSKKKKSSGSNYSFEADDDYATLN